MDGTRTRFWKVALVLLVSLVLAASALAAGGCRPRESLPKTPEELAIKILGSARPDTQDPGVYNVEVDASGELVVLFRYGIMESDAVRQCEVKLGELLRDGFKYESVKSIFVQVDFPFRDKSNNITLEKGITVRMTRAAAEAIDWSIFDPTSLPRAANEWWLDARLGG